MIKIPELYEAPACSVLQMEQTACICASDTDGTLSPYTDNNLFKEDFN